MPSERAIALSAPLAPAGFPPLVQGKKPLSLFEFWPMWLFYAPVVLWALLLALRFRGLLLPTGVNPAFPVGGIVGESKSDILTVAQRYLGENVAPFIRRRRGTGDAAHEAAATLAALQENGLDFPLVAKPDKGCRGAGVRPLYTAAELENYLQHFPKNADVIVQRLIDCEGEAGVFYVRQPHEARGRILSLTLKYFPYVVGDGVSDLHTLIRRDPRAGRLADIYFPRFADRLDSVPQKGEAVRLAFAGNHSKGTIFRNGDALVTPEMEALFDRLSQKIPGFYFGRYDIRFDDFERIRAGETAFTILEINGAGAESTHIWDAEVSLLKAWRDLMEQCYLAWKIGAINRRAGAKLLTPAALWADYRNEKRMIRHYPSTY